MDTCNKIELANLIKFTVNEIITDNEFLDNFTTKLSNNIEKIVTRLINEQTQKIKILEGEVKVSKMLQTDTSLHLENLEQYSRRNSLRLRGCRKRKIYKNRGHR